MPYKCILNEKCALPIFNLAAPLIEKALILWMKGDYINYKTII